MTCCWGGSCTATPGRQYNCHPNGTCHSIAVGALGLTDGGTISAFPPVIANKMKSCVPSPRYYPGFRRRLRHNLNGVDCEGSRGRLSSVTRGRWKSSRFPPRPAKNISDRCCAGLPLVTMPTNYKHSRTSCTNCRQWFLRCEVGVSTAKII